MKIFTEIRNIVMVLGMSDNDFYTHNFKIPKKKLYVVPDTYVELDVPSI